MATAAPGRASGAGKASPVPARPEPGGAALPVKYRGLLTLGVMMATIMQILDTTIANVAIPHMQASLGATRDTINWVLTSYIVASAIAIPITGWLSDRIGSRNLFLIATVGFVIASAMCGAAMTLEEMVAFRILQGITAAFLNPLSQTVMLDINKPQDQGRAMSIWGMGIMVGPIMGPLIGGYLTDNFNWRWVFYVNLPVGVVCFAILWWLLPSRPIRKRQFDIMGFSLLSIGIASLQLMLDRGQDQDWFSSIEIWIEMLVAVIALWMFAVHLFTAKNPMFERELWKHRNLVTGIFFMLVIGLVMMATMALLPPMLQNLYGYSVFQTGMMLMPRGFGVVLTMFAGAQLIQRGWLDPRWSVGVGLLIAAFSLWEMSGWTLEMGSTPFIISGFVQGLGLGLVFMPLNGLAFSGLPPHFRTEGSSLLNLTRNVGASVGISAVSAILAQGIQRSHQYLGEHVTASTMNGLGAIAQQLGASGAMVTGMVDAEVNRQAAMIAYLNDFWLMAIVTAVSVPLVLLLQKPKAPVENDPAAAGH
ncbi:DHA2 family efflux MFS transporter permease subunit [Sphingomonas sp. JC676]|uniref:DHA2 family efflux MFS transporter permease subunit n=1 Tax=Sphingomonas sp. JC676 TaxID=2768065 RepID=UPI001657669C|nr:DHA2 family efflux MFS transporter permease subunit [Sphingomonas sp. JC676]MBC9032060.1 DHA2 family efflux MFS transporter permease subunit [Sphingomonas sp. JC676]